MAQAKTNRTAAVLMILAVGITAVAGWWWRRSRQEAASQPIQTVTEREVQAPTPLAANAVLRVYFLPFNDGDASLSQLREILPLLPRREVRAPTGVAVANVLPEHFRVPRERLPRTLAMLERHVYRDDGEDTVSVVPDSGRIYVPAVPLAPVTEGPVGYSRSVVRRATDAFATLWSRRAYVLSEPSPGAQPAGEGQIADFDVPEGLALNDRTRRLAALEWAALTSNPILIETGEDSTPGSVREVMSSHDLKDLSDIAAKATGDPVDLFIADLDIPKAHYDASLLRIHELCQQVRKAYNLPVVPYRKPSFTAVQGSHTDGIVEALQPLVAVDHGKRVRITYVPLSRAQNVGPVLEELLYVAEIIRIRQVYPNPKAPTAKDANAVTAARAALNALPTSNGAVMRSDGALLDALDLVVENALAPGDARYFINYSWWVRGGVVPLTLPNGRGLTIVAAGNNGVDVHAANQDFAKRALDHDRFLTVMNLDASGARAGNSAKFDPASLQLARVVGFNGTTAGHGSATSWAAPRAAWLLAFAEATAVTRHPSAGWLAALQSRVRALHTNTSPYQSINVGAKELATLW